LNVRCGKCKNAGENTAIKDYQDINFFGVTFKFLVPKTPQKNYQMKKFKSFTGESVIYNFVQE
jgi:hypothetical protein